MSEFEGYRPLANRTKALGWSFVVLTVAAFAAFLAGAIVWLGRLALVGVVLTLAAAAAGGAWAISGWADRERERVRR